MMRMASGGPGGPAGECVGEWGLGTFFAHDEEGGGCHWRWKLGDEVMSDEDGFRGAWWGGK
jgi:hypothetical protein